MKWFVLFFSLFFLLFSVDFVSAGIISSSDNLVNGYHWVEPSFKSMVVSFDYPYNIINLQNNIIKNISGVWDNETNSSVNVTSYSNFLNLSFDLNVLDYNGSIPSTARLYLISKNSGLRLVNYSFFDYNNNLSEFFPSVVDDNAGKSWWDLLLDWIYGTDFVSKYSIDFGNLSVNDSFKVNFIIEFSQLEGSNFILKFGVNSTIINLTYENGHLQSNSVYDVFVYNLSSDSVDYTTWFNDSTASWWLEINNSKNYIVWHKADDNDTTIGTYNFTWAGSGTPTKYFDTGKFNKSVYVNTSATDYQCFYQQMPSTFSTNKWTFEAWYKTPYSVTNGIPSTNPVNDGNNRVFVNCYSTADTGNRLALDLADPDVGTGMRFLVRTSASSSNTYCTSGYSWNANEWVHLAWTWDGDIDQRKWYINGKLICTDNTAKANPTGVTWACGTCWNPPTPYNTLEDTYIDNIRVYNYVKTDFSDRFIENSSERNNHFPTKSYLIATDTGLDIIDAANNNTLWFHKGNTQYNQVLAKEGEIYVDNSTNFLNWSFRDDVYSGTLNREDNVWFRNGAFYWTNATGFCINNSNLDFGFGCENFTSFTGATSITGNTNNIFVGTSDGTYVFNPTNFIAEKGYTHDATVVNGSLSLDGTGDYVKVVNDFDPSTTGISFAYWIRFNKDILGTSQHEAIFKEAHQFTMWYFDEGSYTSIRAYKGKGSGTWDIVSSNFNVSQHIGEWINVVYVWNETNNNLSLYINGVLDNSAVQASDMANYDENFYLGVNSNVGDTIVGSYLDGFIDDFAIYDRPLTPAEVSDIYDRGINHSANNVTNSLLAYYPFDNNFKDYSGNSNDGTAYGDAHLIFNITKEINYILAGNSNNVTALDLDSNNLYVGTMQGAVSKINTQTNTLINNWTYPTIISNNITSLSLGSLLVGTEQGTSIITAFLNTPPYLTNNIPNITFAEDSYNDSINLNNYFTDDQNNIIGWDYTVNNTNIIININNNTGIMNITSTTNYYGTAKANITAKDIEGLTSTSNNFIINITSINDPPVLNIPLINIKALTNKTINLSKYTTDPDNITSQLTWYVQDENTSQIDCNISLNNLTAYAKSVEGTYNCTINVTDGSLWDYQVVYFNVSGLPRFVLNISDKDYNWLCVKW